MLSLFSLLVAPAIQQDLFVQPVSQVPSPGRVVQYIQYGDAFSTGWELDNQGRKQAMRYSHPLASQNGIELELGAFVPGGESAGIGVDVVGHVVGWAEDLVQGVQLRRPFYFDDQNGLQLIDLPQASEGWATGIAIFGHSAAGTMRRADGLLQAWYVSLHPAASQAVPLSTPAGWESEALVMRQDNGVAPLLVGGLVRDPSGREFAAVWGESSNALTILPIPGTGNARLTGLSNSDFSWAKACGYFLDAAGHEQCFVLELNDPVNSFVALPSLGGSWTRPTDMDNFSVWGASENSQGQSRAFEFTLDGQAMEDLNDRANTPPAVALTQVTSSGFGLIHSYDLEVNGVQYGAFSQTVGMSAWPLDSGAPTNLSMFSGPKGSPVAFVFGFTAGSTSVNGFPGLFVDIAQAKIAARGRTDSTGSFVQTLQVPAGAAGLTVLIQAVVPNHSITTSVKIVTFE
ncbi:MAG: hypothetical protein OTJ44_09220 [Planctomycetota bacterium]|nr:hypothetical protein [Planctomycetota bacterium]